MDRIIDEKKIMEFKNALLEDEKSQNTIKKYLRDLRQFEAFLLGRAMEKKLVIEYKSQLVSSFTPSSVNSKLAAINCFLKFQGWHDCTVKALKIQHQAFRIKERELTKEEYFRLLDTSKRKNNMRLYFVLQTLCSTGIRVGELKFITVEAVMAGYAQVSFKGKSRLVLIPKNLAKELQGYISEHNIKTGSVFITRNGNALDRNNILHEMKAICPDARVDSRKVFPHNLRHLFACTYYRAEKDLNRLADLLGHSNINTTRIYTSVNGAEQQQQIERLGLVEERNTA